MKKNFKGASEEDFTSLYIASDSASKKAQRFYILIVAIDLIAMIIAAAIAIYNYHDKLSRTFLYTISGILLLLSLMLTIILLTKKFEDMWYQGRALAESCKTLSWRFMTCSELFENNIPLPQAKESFTARVKELGREFPDLTKELDVALLNKPLVTELMIRIRNSSLEDRKKYYIQNRIEEQKLWYSKKARYNKTQYNFWFMIIITTQALSLVTITYLIANSTSDWNFVSFFTTISAAALSWLQLKRHQELKQAYTTASQELTFIVTLSDSISDERDFSKFVLDSENAVSREHTLWLAQRRK